MRTLQVFAVALVVLLLAACDDGGGGSSDGGSGGGGGGGGGGGTHTPTTSEAQLAQEVLTLVNQERAAVGLAALTWDPPCAQVAFNHSWDMDARDFFSHTNPDGLDPFDRMAAAGVGYSTAGENIAAGYTTAAAAMTGWMNSPGHKANILNVNYTHMGVGVRQGSTGGYGTYWTQLFRKP